MSTAFESAPCPPDLVCDLTSAVARQAQMRSAGQTAPGADLQQVLSRCDDPTRRHELDQFITRVGQLPVAEQAAFAASLSETQVRSKLWLIDELARSRNLAASSLVVLGAWYGILPLLMNWRVRQPPQRMRCIDIDETVCAVGRQVIGAIYSNVTYVSADIMDLDYAAIGTDPTTIVINTICEHLPDLPGWGKQLADGQVVVLQSNNYRACPDHVNWVESVDALHEQVPLSRVFFSGVLPLQEMDRYMLIGQR